MRQKPPKPEAVNKLIRFLQDLKLYCEGTGNVGTISKLHELHQVSRSTASVCKSLGLIEKTDEGYIWKGEEPSKRLALIILNAMLEKSPKSLKAEQIPEFANLLSGIERLTTTMEIYISQNKNRSNGLKIASNEIQENKVNLFTADDTERQYFFELAKSVAAGVYANYDPLTPFQLVNDNIIKFTADLLTKINNHKQLH
jgi:hypothetical protein